jgi:GxxExxY protein
VQSREGEIQSALRFFSFLLNFAPPPLRVTPSFQGTIMTEDEISKIVVDCAFQVHQKLGPGLLESVYEVALAHEIKKRGLSVERQVAILVVYDDLKFDEGFRADIIVAGSVILELKSVEQVHPVHKKQLLTYLRLSDKRLGYLTNFGAELIMDGLSRVSNGAADWREEESREGAKPRRETAR